MGAFFFGFIALFGQYDFAGKHFVASYLECDEAAIGNVDALRQAMDEAVAASGATILDSSYFIFEPNGITLVYLLSESHASIHTYPEHGACFVDLFTCGNHCSAENFDQSLKNYLKPQQVSSRFLLRGEEVVEVAQLQNNGK